MNSLPITHTLMGFFDAPHAGAAARERLDLALALAAADWPLALLFAGPGVLLLANRGGADEVRDFPAALGTLELFGVTEVFAEAAALERYGLNTDSTRIPVKALSGAQLRDIMGRQSCLS
ncbi:MAG: DsrE family protein [Lysobacterales bacterium]